MRIVVNAVEMTTQETRLSYYDVVNLAGYPPGSIPTVTYTGGRVEIDVEQYQNHGSLSPGESVFVRDGMRFSIAYAGNA